MIWKWAICCKYGKKGATHGCVLEKRSFTAQSYSQRVIDLLIMGTAGTNTKPALKTYSAVTFKGFRPIEIILSVFPCLLPS